MWSRDGFSKFISDVSGTLPVAKTTHEQKLNAITADKLALVSNSLLNAVMGHSHSLLGMIRSTKCRLFYKFGAFDSHSSHETLMHESESEGKCGEGKCGGSK